MPSPLKLGLLFALSISIGIGGGWFLIAHGQPGSGLAENKSVYVEPEVQGRTPGDALDSTSLSKSPTIIDSKIDSADLELLSDPNDPLCPKNVAGSSDASVKHISDQRVEEVLSAAFKTPPEGLDEARYQFNLGRLAFFHSRQAEAKEYFRLAAKGGSIPAKAYLAKADLYQTPDSPESLSERLKLLEDASARGYKPAISGTKEVEHKIEELIDKATAHPNDPQKPKAYMGRSDDQIVGLDPEYLSDLITNLGPYAKQLTSPPRLAFGLGRAAFKHGNLAVANEFLTNASLERPQNNRSIGALGYIAQLPANSKEYGQNIEYLKQAVDAGFSDLNPKLLEAIDTQQNKEFSLDRFTMREIIEQLYNGNYKTLMSRGAQFGSVPMDRDAMEIFRRPLTLVYMIALTEYMEDQETGYLGGLEKSLGLPVGGTGAIGELKMKETFAGPMLNGVGKLLPVLEVASQWDQLTKGDPQAFNKALGLGLRVFTDDGWSGPMESRIKIIQKMAAMDARKLFLYYKNDTKEPVQAIYKSAVLYINEYHD